MTPDAPDTLDTLVRAVPLEGASVGEFLAAIASDAPTVAAALLAGARADRLALAFAAGYREALRALVAPLPSPLAPALRALAATEARGGHPRALATTFDGATLRGEKTFVTLGDLAERALVVARVGEVDGRPELAVVDVALDGPGVVRTVLPPLPFCPELVHATVHFDDAPVPASARLPGDGYARWLKPFRTHEDLHVHAALLGYLATLARGLAPPPAGASALERALALSSSALGLASSSPSSVAGHLALGALLEGAERLFADVASALPAGEVRARLERDAPLLRVAGKARAARLEAARRVRLGRTARRVRAPRAAARPRPRAPRP